MSDNWSIELETGEAVAPDVGCAQRFEVKAEQGEVYFGYQLKAGHDQSLSVRPELVEACPELAEWG
ncbi:MAG: hypothetical protein WCI11_13750 [Candidatus Methylumidiphilus sp.]